jgi:hypothetical protein
VASQHQHTLAASDTDDQSALVKITATWPVSARDGVLAPYAEQSNQATLAANFVADFSLGY